MKRTILILFLIFGIAALCVSAYRMNMPRAGEVHIAFLSVGQGDAAYIAFPDGTDMLVDCGKDRRVLAALGRRMRFFDRTIDYLVATHPDADHYGGCIDVLKRFRVKHIVTNGTGKAYDPLWRTFDSAASAEGAKRIVIDREQVWDIASSSIHFLFPDRPADALPGDAQTNNKSIVFSLAYGSSSALFTGDAEKELEDYLIGKYGAALESDVLKVGHHGSPSSSDQPFVHIVSPRDAVISVGKENRYGHPSLRVVRRLERGGARVWRTDEMGDILASFTRTVASVWVK